MSDPPYSSDDKLWINAIASQVAVSFAQL